MPSVRANPTPSPTNTRAPRVHGLLAAGGVCPCSGTVQVESARDFASSSAWNSATALG